MRNPTDHFACSTQTPQMGKSLKHLPETRRLRQAPAGRLDWDVSCDGKYGWINGISYFECFLGTGECLGTAHFSGICIPERKTERDVANNSPEVEAVCALLSEQAREVDGTESGG